LRKALKQAVVWQLRPTNPAHAVEARRSEEKEMQPVDEQRAAVLIESAENTEMYIPILMRSAQVCGAARSSASGGAILTWTIRA
jgi:hypothetical protein